MGEVADYSFLILLSMVESQNNGKVSVQSLVMHLNVLAIVVTSCLLPANALALSGISDMARTSEFWVIAPYGLSRHMDYPTECALFRGRFIRTDDWLMPERFVHDEEVVRGVKQIGQIGDAHIVGTTFAGDYFVIDVRSQQTYQVSSERDWHSLLATRGIPAEQELLTFEQAEQLAFGSSGWWRSWMWVPIGACLLLGFWAIWKRRGRVAVSASGA